MELGSTNFSTNLLDIDVSKIDIDLANNSITLQSYYIDDYSITFHFLDKEHLWIKKKGTYLNIASYYVNPDGVVIAKIGTPSYTEETEAI